MKQLWDRTNNMVFGEPAMFANSNHARTLFPVKKIVRVYRETDPCEFKFGKDFAVEQGELRRTADSAIPFIGQDELYPPDGQCVYYGQPNPNAIASGTPGKNLRLDMQGFFARNQVLIDYEAQDLAIPEELLAFGLDKLPKLRRCLKLAQPVKISCLGDSISAGADATKILNIAPNSPPYLEQFTEGLSDHCHAAVTLHNHAIGGTLSKDAMAIQNKWLGDRSDLLVIAYGMNDFGATETAAYISNINTVIETALENWGECEFLLLASMPGNAQWNLTPPHKAAEFAAALENFTKYSPGIAVCNVYRVWNWLLQRKNFFDLTGNGVNHPNDYGHSVYAHCLLKTVFNLGDL